jgi:hypothetical protein
LVQKYSIVQLLKLLNSDLLKVIFDGIYDPKGDVSGITFDIDKTGYSSGSE